MRQLKIMTSYTSRASQSLDRYLNDINKIPLLTFEQEADMAKRAREGDEAALDLLVRSNLRFVVSVAKQYQHRGVDLVDVINEGNLGLIKAASRFDETKGFRFISFAVWWIRQNILQSIASQCRTIRLPLNQISSITYLNKQIAKLEQEIQRNPTTAEIAEALDQEEDKIKAQLTYAQLSVSLHSAKDQEFSPTLLDVLYNDADAADRELMLGAFKQCIGKVLNLLSPRERFLISRYYGLENQEALSLEEIAVVLKIGKERARQLRDIALGKLSNLKEVIKNKIINDD